MRYKAVLPIVVVLVLLLAVACSSTAAEGPVGLIPQGADAVGHVNVSQLLSDSDLIGIYNALPKDADSPQTFEAALDAFQEETGVDPRAFDELYIFGAATTVNDDTDYGGVIGIGVFEATAFIDSAEDATGVNFAATTHEGYDMYVDQEEDAAVAFLDEETVVVGTIQAVTDVIDVKAGKASPVGGEVLDAYTGLGSRLVELAASVKDAVTVEDLQGANETLSIGIPIDLSSLADAQLAQFTLSRDGQEITAHLEVSFSNSSSAKDAKGLVSMVKAFVNTYGVPGEGVGDIEVPEEGRDLIPKVLASLETRVDGLELTIGLTMTFEEIDLLLSQQAAT